MSTINMDVFNLACDFSGCPPEDAERKARLSHEIEKLRGQDSEDCLMYSLMLFCARGSRERVLADLQAPATVAAGTV